jgi:energy-coupling factor transport system ATP-binding protein
VATAIAAAPGVVILDEPTFGQDQRTWRQLLDLLSQLRDDGCGVVAVTHDTDFAAALADRSMALGTRPAEGTRAAQGTQPAQGARPIPETAP